MLFTLEFIKRICKRTFSFNSIIVVCLTAYFTIFSGISIAAPPSHAQGNPPAHAMNKGKIVIEKTGSFSVGGEVLGEPETSSLSCDHGYVEYFIPHKPREVSLLMWHSSSTAVWENRWDGEEGYKGIFLRRGYPVYLWDGPRVGRANWSCAPITYTPGIGRDQGNFGAWRFGIWPNWFAGVQFPDTHLEPWNNDAWNQATRARYNEFDTLENVQLQTDAGAQAVDKIGPVVILTNSAGGFRALLTAIKSETDNVKGIVAYENPGFIFPEGEGPPAGSGGFGPIKVPLEEFMKLTEFPIQMVWGDNVDQSAFWQSSFELSQQFVDIVNAHGGNASMLVLPVAGLEGNTHIPMADLNNEEVADLLSLFLEENGLDGK